jgi:hypothetical protein
MRFQTPHPDAARVKGTMAGALPAALEVALAIS